jgi:hypothetical protein
MALLLVQVRSGGLSCFCTWSAIENAATIPGFKIDGALVAPLGCSGTPLEWWQYTRQPEAHRYQRLGSQGANPWLALRRSALSNRATGKARPLCGSALCTLVDLVFDLPFLRAGSLCVSLRLEHRWSRLKRPFVPPDGTVCPAGRGSSSSRSIFVARDERRLTGP